MRHIWADSGRMTMMSTSVAVPTTGHYVLDAARCSITFRARQVFGLAKVGGRFTVTGGEMTIAEPVTGSSITARASAGSIDTGLGTRDRTVRSARFLDAETFPEMVFTSTSVGEEHARAVVRGTLTAHGRTAPICLKVVQSTNRGSTVTIRAYGSIDRRAFGITAARWLAGRHLQVELTAVGTRA